MNKENMEQLIKETSREEFEQAIAELSVEEIDEILFELRLRLSNIRSKMATTQINKKLAEMQGEDEKVKDSLKRLSALHSAEGWLKSKEMIANRMLEKRIGKPEAERLLDSAILKTG